MRTDVPSGWSTVCLADIAHEVTERNSGEPGIPVLSVTKYDGFVPSLSYFKKQVFSRDTANYKLVHKGQFAYATIHLDEGSIDLLDRHEFGLISPMYTVFEPNTSLVDPTFLRYRLKSPEFVRGYSRLGQGSINRRKSISFEALGQIVIPFPPLAEQKKIAAVLGSVDEAIQATQAVIDQTRKVKQGLLQQLLTRGIGHTRFKKTEIGEIPQEWEVKALSAVVPLDRPITYGIVQAGPHVPDGVPYIRVSDMGGRELTLEGMLRTSSEIARRYKRAEVQPGDVVYALRGTIGLVLPVPSHLAGANLTQGTARVAPGPDVLPSYLLWALRSPMSLKQAELESKGSTFREISLAKLNVIKIPIPPKQEQSHLLEIMTAYETFEDTNADRLASLQNLKRGLMQDLLTGRVRVKGVA